MRRAVLVCGLTALLAGAAAAGGRPAPGDAAPPLRLSGLDGSAVTLESYRGRPVLLHFWATWCPHCLKEMPLLDRLAREHAGRLVVLGVNLGERRRKVADYVAASQLTFPILLDTRGRAAAAFGVVSLPTTLVVDPGGKIAAEIPMGTMTAAEVVEKLRPFL